MLIENTAGGDSAMARRLDAIGRLWDAVERPSDDAVGFCLDTCHAHAGGETSPTRSTGSRPSPAGSTWCTATTRGTSSAPAGTGTPTSATGTIDPDLLLGVVRAAGAPVICETPDENGGLAADISWLKQHLAG